MTNESIRQALSARPFIPFTIRMADGRAFAVRHPEMLLAPQGARTIVLYLGDERYNMIDLLLVSSLDFDERRRSRGSGRKKAG